MPEALGKLYSANTGQIFQIIVILLFPWRNNHQYSICVRLTNTLVIISLTFNMFFFLLFIQYRCDFCSKPYTNYMSLRNHMRIHGQKRYMCDRCGKAFRLARYLRNHQRIHDDGPNRFDCPSCSKSYRTMLELAQHRCSAATPSQVGVCKMVFRNHSCFSGVSKTIQRQTFIRVLKANMCS